MKFLVSRTSDWNHSKPPCDEATEEIVTRLIQFTRATNESLEQAKDRAIKKGFSIEKDITKDTFLVGSKVTRWFIELNSLEMLTEIFTTIVIEPAADYKEYPDLWEIEIYDDYRE